MVAILLGENEIIDVAFILTLQQVGQIQLVGFVILTEFPQSEVHHSVGCNLTDFSFVTELPDEGIRSCPAIEDIVAGTSDQGVVSALTKEDIVTLTTDQDVIASLTIREVEFTMVLSDVLVDLFSRNLIGIIDTKF